MKAEKRRNDKHKAKININKNIIYIAGAVLLIIVIAIIAITGNKENSETSQTGGENKPVYVEEIEDGVKINKSSKLNTAKEVDGITISNIQLTTKDGITTLLADATNNSGAKTGLKTVKITLINQNGEDIIDLTGIIGELEAGATTQINISMTADYINAYDFRVTAK